MSAWQRFIFTAFISVGIFSVLPSAHASFHFHWPHIKRSNVRSLEGKKYSLAEENQMANQDRLVRIANDATLKYFQQTGMLVHLPQNNQIKIDKRLEKQFRWCRPWVSSFLLTFAADYYRHFHTPLQINSAIRTVAFQTHLRRINPNAAAPFGPTASTHLTGATVDIAKKNMNPRELAWARNYLIQKVQAYRIHVIEEFHQSVFHIMVGRNYSRKMV